MSNKRPLVSVLMNCYNGERYLRPAIESVLNQTYGHWEIVFWDNQSTDASADICRSYGDARIKYYRAERHTSLGEARATAFERVSGDLTSVLDTDDLWLPTKLEKQIALFDDPAVGIVICDTLFFTDDGKQRPLYAGRIPKQGYVFDDLVKSYFVSLETVVMRTEAIRRLTHAFDAGLSHVADMDLIVRLSKDWKLACVPEALAKWRVHPSSGTWTEPERFFKERNAFTGKMDGLPDYAQAWRGVRGRFVERTYVAKAVRLLAGGRVPECRQVLKECPEKGRLWAAVALASRIPFAADLVARYQARRHLA
jgi:glycosyltransferase involved in cell wall biosynthesis